VKRIAATTIVANMVNLLASGDEPIKMSINNKMHSTSSTIDRNPSIAASLTIARIWTEPEPAS